MAHNSAPLHGSFMIMAIVGFFLSYFLVYRKGLTDWGISFMIVFAIMLIASLVSMNDLEVQSSLRMGSKKKAGKKK